MSIKYIAITVSHSDQVPMHEVRRKAFEEAKRAAAKERAVLLTEANQAQSATVDRLPFAPGVSLATAFTYEVEVDDDE